MSLSVGAGFQALLASLVPTPTQVAAATKHKDSVRAVLDARYGTYRFFQSGSFSHGTGVRYYSDVDYFASLKTTKPQSSDSALASLKGTLQSHYPNTTVKIRRPAVVIEFASGLETFELVPGWLLRGTDNSRVYHIPGPRGGWLESAPDAHRAYVNNSNSSPAGGAKGLARLLKAWKYYRSVPVSSFYLEMRAAKYMTGENSIIWSIDLRSILSELSVADLAAMNDPSGLTARIHAYSSDSSKADAVSKLERALTRANRARTAEGEGRISAAFEAWDVLFNGHFPSYG
ncbi:MAG: hypothetical protein WKF96_14990 [Solirubrobacteraceae bacterium]